MENSIVEYNPIREAMARAEEESNFVPDTSTPEGYRASKDISLKLTKSLTTLEKVRTEIKAPVLERGKAIDSEAKEIKAKLEKMRFPHQQAYKAFDAAEKERKEAEQRRIQDKIDGIRSCVQHAADMDSDSIVDMAENLMADPMEGFGKMADEALAVRGQVVMDLRRIADRRKAEEQEAKRQEEERLRLEEQRKAIEAEREQMRIEEEKRRERERIEREERDKELEELRRMKREKEEAEERERIAAEAKAEAEREAEAERKRIIEAQQRAEQEAREAEERAAKQAEEAAEQARNEERQRQIEEKERIEREAAEREANAQHIANIRGEAKQAIMALGYPEDAAKVLVMAIHNGKIPHVSINY